MAGAVLSLSAPVGAAPIEGQVYDAATGEPAAGVQLTIVYDGNDFEAGQVVPDDRLGDDQQGQVTGADGRYRFDVEPVRFYQLQLDTSATSLSAPSAVIPPRPGLAPLGDVVDSSEPVSPSEGSADRSYYLRFEIPAADSRVSNNHIAVDRVADLVTLDKRADRSEVTTGDIVYYTLTVTNRSSRDLTAAANTPMYITDTPPRGLTYVKGKAVVQVSEGTSKVTSRVSDDQEDFQRRLIRFGPFDLAAGGTLVLRYAVVVGGDTRPGRYTNRAVVSDAGGSALSNEALAQVEVTGDDALDAGVILGRVYCDANGNGTYDGGERGVMGARVYIDTGSYAVTDSAGMYHLSNVRGGTRLVKLDEATLGGGTLAGEAAHTLRLTDGLSAKVSFAAICVAVDIDGTHDSVRVVATTPAKGGAEPPAPTGVALTGATSSATLTVGQRFVELPEATLQLVGDNNLAPVPDAGYGTSAVYWAPSWFAPDGVDVARWTLTINRLGDGDSLTPIRTVSGTGALPNSITWDGLRDDALPAARDTLYAAQLVVVGSDRKAEAASAYVPFGIAYGLAAGGPRSEQWTGALFGGTASDPKVLAALEGRIATLVASLADGDTIDIAVHWDGTGDEIATIAHTQKEARLVVELLVAAGVAEDAIKARGRGSLEPVDASNTKAARALNRRVAVTVTPAPSATAGNAIPTSVAVTPEVLIDGTALDLDAGGAFSTDMSVDASVVIDMRGPDGARSAMVVWATPPPAPPAPRTSAVKVEGDFGAGAFAVGDVALAPELLALDTSLNGAAPGETPNVLTSRGSLRTPLEFALTAPANLQAASWTLAISDESGKTVHKAAGDGAPPASVDWDGKGTDGAFALESDVLYEYVLSVSTASQGRGSSPVRTFSVDFDPKGIKGVAKKATLYKGGSTLTTTFKNHLSKVVTILKGRPATERWAVRIATVPSRGSSESDVVLELAARRATTKKYLIRLGLDEERFDVTMVEGTGRDEFDVVPVEATAEVTSAMFVEVAGSQQQVDGQSFSTTVDVVEGQPVTVVLGAPNGGYAEYVVTPVAVGTVGDPEPAPEPEPMPEAEHKRANPEPVAAGDLHVWLPPEGTVLRARQLGVTGRTRALNRIFIGGDTPYEVLVAADGTFSAVVDLPVGRSDLIIQSVDLAGNKAVLTWPVNVDQRYLFAMAMAEGIVSTSYTERGLFADTSVLDGMTEDSTVTVGPFVVHGRAVAYVKARVSGGWLSKYMEITGHVDTAKVQGTGAFFEDVMNPERDFPVFGDSGEQVRDVNSRGKLYLRVEAGESSAVIGSIHTDIDEGLLRYDRTVSGAMVDINKDITGTHRVEVKAFGTSGDEGLQRDVNWYRATGGSLYYMRHSSVAEGSERVRVVVRDRDNGMVVSERILERNIDYTVDYPGGRILLIEPLASTASSAWLLDNFDHSTAPFDGHPVYVEVRYEHSDQSADTEASGGAYVRYSTDLGHADAHISGGVGQVYESRGADDYSLTGADATLTMADGGTISFAQAYSTESDAGNMLSQDGGLTFLDLNSVSEIAGKTSGRAQMWQLDAMAGELVRWVAPKRKTPKLDKLRVKAYRLEVDRGFSAGGSALDQGHTRDGVILAYQLSKTDTVSFRIESDVALVPRVGPTRADIDANPDQIALDERAARRTTLQWGRAVGKWNHRAEAGYNAVSSTAALADGTAQLDAQRVGAAVGTAYAYNARLTLRAAQRGIVGLTDADPQLNPIVPGDSTTRESDPLAGLTTNAGADLLLTGDVVLGADWYQRWNGDNAGQISMRSALSDTGSMYVRERVESRAGDVVSTTVVGADDEIAGTNGARTYGEYQIENGALGNRNRAVLGLGHRWQASRGLRVSVGFEHQQVFGGFLPDGTPIGDNQRNVVYGGVDFTRIENLKAAATIELRVDNAAAIASIDDLIRDDPRSVADPGDFGEHGGVAPGSPLVLAPGERIQIVGGLGANYAINADHTALARFRFGHSTADEGTGADEYTAARYTALTTGWAYRPLEHDWFAVLARYSFLTDKRPVLSGMNAMDSRSHVAALIPIVDLPHDLTLAGKVAFKRTEAISTMDGDDTDLSADSILWLLRLGYGFYGRWDASVELRQLFVRKPESDESRSGSLVELGYDLGRRVRIGTGYNFSHFSDNELGDLVRDSHGFFVRVTGHY